MRGVVARRRQSSTPRRSNLPAMLRRRAEERCVDAPVCYRMRSLTLYTHPPFARAQGGQPSHHRLHALSQALKIAFRRDLSLNAGRAARALPYTRSCDLQKPREQLHGVVPSTPPQWRGSRRRALFELLVHGARRMHAGPADHGRAQHSAYQRHALAHGVVRARAGASVPRHLPNAGCHHLTSWPASHSKFRFPCVWRTRT